jgi:hypothetical protein
MTAQEAGVSIHQRGKVYWLKRRVPKRYASFEARKEIWRSLKTDSPAAAKQKAEAVWSELIEGWEARLAGRSDEAEERFAAAQDLADARAVCGSCQHGRWPNCRSGKCSSVSRPSRLPRRRISPTRSRRPRC